MTRFDWADRFFDTKEKRYHILFWIVLLYWLWQWVWQTVFFWKLFGVNDYQTLFEFYSSLESLAHALPIRWILCVMTRQMYYFSIWDVVFILLSLIVLPLKRQWAIPVGIYLVVNGIGVVMALSAGSLEQVIRILHIMSGVSVGIGIYISILILWTILGLFLKRDA